MRKVVVLMALAALALPAASQPAPDAGTALRELLGGTTFPLTVKMKDLDSNWSRLNAGTSDIGGYMSMLMAMFGGGGAAGAYYTRGQTVVLGGETFVVVYRPKSRPLDPQLLRRTEPPTPEKLTPDTVLALGLLNLRTVSSLTDIRPFDLAEEVADSGAGASPVAGSKEQTSLSNLKQLGLGLLMYTQDYDEVMPPMNDAAKLQQVLQPYVKNTAIFTNPVTQRPYRPNAVLSRHKMAQIAAPAEMAVYYEDSPSPDGTRGVVYLDGHAKRVPESEWLLVKRRSKIP